jgi:hypothetical protein
MLRSLWLKDKVLALKKTTYHQELSQMRLLTRNIMIENSCQKNNRFRKGNLTNLVVNLIHTPHIKQTMLRNHLNRGRASALKKLTLHQELLTVKLPIKNSMIERSYQKDNRSRIENLINQVVNLIPILPIKLIIMKSLLKKDKTSALKKIMYHLVLSPMKQRTKSSMIEKNYQKRRKLKRENPISQVDSSIHILHIKQIMMKSPLKKDKTLVQKKTTYHPVLSQMRLLTRNIMIEKSYQKRRRLRKGSLINQAVNLIHTLPIKLITTRSHWLRDKVSALRKNMYHQELLQMKLLIKNSMIERSSQKNKKSKKENPISQADSLIPTPLIKQIMMKSLLKKDKTSALKKNMYHQELLQMKQRTKSSMIEKNYQKDNRLNRENLTNQADSLIHTQPIKQTT